MNAVGSEQSLISGGVGNTPLDDPHEFFGTSILGAVLGLYARFQHASCTVSYEPRTVLRRVIAIATIKKITGMPRPLQAW